MSTAVAQAAYSVELRNGALIVMRAPYRPSLVEAQKVVPGRRWDGVRQVNTFPLAAAPYIAALLKRFPDVEWQLSPQIEKLLTTARMPATLPTPYKCRVLWMDREHTAVGVSLSAPNKQMIGSIRRVRGVHFDAVRRLNVFELDADTAHELTRWLSRHRPVWCEDGVRDTIWELAKEGAEREETRTLLAGLSSAEDADIEIEGLGGELMPFQKAGVNYVLKAGRRCFIADDMGTGKTAQALAALHATDAFPAVIVCPASVKLPWRDHVRGPAPGAPDGWLPGRTVLVLEGRKPRPLPSAVSVVVVNYDVLPWWLDTLRAIEPRAVIFDESHLLKSPQAKRTKAAIALADAVPEGGLKLNLSGTAVLNNPTEIGSQLRAIGRLDEFGGYAGLRKRRSAAKLNAELRGTCFVRRTKDQVMPELPEKRIARVPVELSNRSEYERVERDVIRWLVDQVELTDSIAHLPEDEQRSRIRERQSETAWKAMRAQRLVQLNALRQVCAKGKLRAATSWIGDFLHSTDEKLVLFATHVAIQRELRHHYADAAQVLGEDDASQRNDEIQRFQNDPACRLIVCSLQAAGVGITLTAASNVAFLELGWTPALHDQAEDRLHRIGQKGNVVAWYLLAENTIDDDMHALLESKRAVVSATLDGKASTRDENIIDELEARLLAKASAGRADSERGQDQSEHGAAGCSSTTKDDQASASRPAVPSPSAGDTDSSETHQLVGAPSALVAAQSSRGGQGELFESQTHYQSEVAA